MAKKHGFYAVHKGRTPGIYTTWEETEAQVKGFKDPRHKKFSNREAAENFLATGIFGEDTADTKGKKRAAPDDNGPLDQSDMDVVYCDGACKNNQNAQIAKAGFGVWWGRGDPRNVAKRCPGDQTNNRAELLAILEILLTTPITSKTLIIKTDSKYCINSFGQWIHGWRARGWISSTGGPVKNKPIIQYIAAHLDRRAQRNQKVVLEHVKGHSGVEGNEGADELAVAGASLPFTAEPDWDAERVRLEQAVSAEDLPGSERAEIEVIGDPEEPQDLSIAKINEDPVLESARSTIHGSPTKMRRLDPAVKSPAPFSSPANLVLESPGKYTVTVDPSPEELEDYANCLVDDDSDIEELRAGSSPQKPHPRTPPPVPQQSIPIASSSQTPGRVSAIATSEPSQEDLDAFAEGWDIDLAAELSD